MRVDDKASDEVLRRGRPEAKIEVGYLKAVWLKFVGATKFYKIGLPG